MVIYFTDDYRDCDWLFVCFLHSYFYCNVFIYLIFTGYIPRTWICKTLNLHLDKLVHRPYKMLVIFIIFYILDQCGKLIVFVFSSSSSMHPLDRVAGLLDLSLLFHLWISATFLLFTWYITLLLFKIFVTEVRVQR